MPAHDAKCAAVGNIDMSTPTSAMMASAMILSTPGIVMSRSPGVSERGDQLVDARLETLEGLVDVVEVSEDLTDHQGMVRAEPARQRRLQQGDLGPQPAPGQLGKYLRVAAASDESVEHVAAGRRSEEHTSELQSLMRISY